MLVLSGHELLFWFISLPLEKAKHNGLDSQCVTSGLLHVNFTETVLVSYKAKKLDLMSTLETS